MNADSYLHRIGVDPDSVRTPDRETLERLQRAHIEQVPFENLSIVGDPHGPYEGERIELTVQSLYDKIVRDSRGGYCFELNGLFYWLLTELGYEADRIAARVIDDDGARPPANHHSIVIQLDRRYVVDVGLGTPKMRRPLPITGDAIETADYDWRVAESDRPDEESVVQARRSSSEGWESRYLFTDIPRDFCYFRATNDYLQTAPESTFTGSPIVNIATESGYLRCSTETFTVCEGESTSEREIDEPEWYDVLDSHFGIGLPGL